MTLAAGAGRVDTSISVGLGEMAVVKDSNESLICIALGSCIGIAAYDRQAMVAGLVHIVLPDSQGRNATKAGKYADLAVPTLIDAMTELGASGSRLTIKIAGGAHMALTVTDTPLFKIGEQNISAARAALNKAGLTIVAEEIGGNRGRNLRIDGATGITEVSAAGKPARQI